MSALVSIENLERGVQWWRGRPRWSQDLHADLYARQHEARRGGLTETWWDETVRDLGRWNALRGQRRAVIRERGRARLSSLARANEAIGPEGGGLEVLTWSDVEDLFEIASEIKKTRTNSPVFPSKLCHFIRPEAFVVVDNEVIGRRPYRAYWALAAEEWVSASPLHDELRALLDREASHSDMRAFPYGPKIIELCLIGSRR